jgi:hypothetical protein
MQLNIEVKPMANEIRGSGYIPGTSGDDRIFGDVLVDFIEGFEGNDEIWGNDGGDRIYGWYNNGPSYTGQPDNDVIYGEGGTDILDGGPGDDHIFGGPGPAGINVEILDGGDDNDVLIGGLHNDRLIGDDGNDIMVGTDFQAAGIGEIDTMEGYQGADLFVLGETYSGVEEDNLRVDELTGQSKVAKLYYADNDFNTAGLDDFAHILDFRPAFGDKIQLPEPTAFGRFNRYETRPSPIAGVEGQAIYYNALFAEPELIAIVRFGGRNPDRPLDLDAQYMEYVSQPLILELPPDFPFEPIDPFPPEIIGGEF